VTSTVRAEPDATAERADIHPESAVVVASQWRLIWWRFRRHRLAMLGLAVTVLLYSVVIFADFLAPYSAGYSRAEFTYAPPMVPHLDIGDANVYVHEYASERDPETFERTWTVDRSSRTKIGLFVHGEEYKLLGLFTTDIHLFGPTSGVDGPPLFLLGSDKDGHDLLSRVILGARVSMSIGLVGVGMAFGVGTVLGAISGYVGGRVDTAIQRLVELFTSLPTLPLWMALAAAVPTDWSPLRRYFAITIILSFIAWTDLARVVRGRFLALRETDVVTAARLDAARQPRIIFRHLLPSMYSHLIASLSLSIPAMILAETSLSFLGLGLQPPTVSWGVLLQAAQNVRALATAPWLLLPGLAVVIAVLALNFLGDGLRDAADPYK